MKKSSLTRYAWLSVIAAITTIGLKSAAYLLTGSVGLLSDALESLVNLIGATVALAMLSIAAKPPDDEHSYGHDKAEYFSSGAEGTLIIIAAITIIWTAWQRLISPQPIEQAGLGLVVSVIASGVNFMVARVLLRVGKQHHSIALEADGRHLMTDVWTSGGVISGVAVVAITGWQRFDPLIALAVAANIMWEGGKLLRRTVAGLMDAALPESDQARIKNILAKYESQGIEFHALRTRQAGARRFVSMHVLTPGSWTVHKGHQLLESIEGDIRGAIPNAAVFTHLESLDDTTSWQDMSFDR